MKTVPSQLTSSLVVGTAGWSIPKRIANEFPTSGSGLTRYAARFRGVEIDTTFYRSHRAGTYARWRDSVPAGFLFGVKLPRIISHEKRLRDAGRELEAFLEETGPLGEHRGPILIQLPPKLAFDEQTAVDFFRQLRRLFAGPAVIEPRHVTWFSNEVDELLVEFEIARVGADPPHAEGGDLPGGYRGMTYLRLHGSPRVYFSSYSREKLDELLVVLSRISGPAWCVFDNTASGAAGQNALELQALLAI